MTSAIDHQRLASEWLRALRGRRSQRALSRRLGYRTNIAYRWESGLCWPYASTVWAAMVKLGCDTRMGLEKFFQTAPRTVVELDLTSRGGIAALLQYMRQHTPIVAIAAETGHSRFSVSRWLKAESEPRWPEFLQLVDACSLRLVDFVSAFFDPAQLPCITARAKRLDATRRAAYELPLSHAVLRLLELSSYQALRRHRRGWIAERLGVAQAEETRCLQLLSEAGQVRWNGARWQVVEQGTIDTRADPALSRKLRTFWGRRAVDALANGEPGKYVFNLMSVSAKDLERLKELQTKYFREMRAIVADSEPSERVVLYCSQLVPLHVNPEEAAD